MKKFEMFLVLLCLSAYASAQSTPQSKSQEGVASDISGMYSFLRDGEYVQLTIEAQGKVSGVISRFGDLDSDRGAFLDQFIDKGGLEDNRLTFITRPLHGVVFEFKGTVTRGKGKTPAEEAYYVLKGTLTQYLSDESDNRTAKSREVEFKSFPEDVGSAAPHKRD